MYPFAILIHNDLKDLFVGAIINVSNALSQIFCLYVFLELYYNLIFAINTASKSLDCFQHGVFFI